MPQLLQKIVLVAICSPFILLGALAFVRVLDGSQHWFDGVICGTYFLLFGTLCIGFIWRRMARGARGRAWRAKNTSLANATSP